MPNLIDINNQIFGKLKVIRHVKGTYWECQCECGQIVTRPSGSLRDGSTKSCGCLKIETAGNATRRHGCTNTKEYRLWSAIKDRCYYKGYKLFHRYGGRGIKMCDRWINSFENFLSDMGKIPEGMTIDRIDNDGDYSPENCRWATKTEQAQNRSTTRYVEWNGEKMCLSEFTRQLGLPIWGLRHYIRHKKMTPIEAAFMVKYGEMA